MKFSDDIREEAANWFAALRRGPMTVEERSEYDVWRQSPVNQAALNSMHELWGELAGLNPDAVKPQHSPVVSRRWLPVAASVALMVGAGALFVSWPGAEQGSSQIATAIGEQRTATMPDGSVITANVATKLAFAEKHNERTVDLGEGEAVFFVRKDKSRPFLVRTEDYEVRAVGTAFNVRNRDGQLDVAVIEGVVAIKALSGPRRGQEIARITAGKRVSLGDATALPPTTAVVAAAIPSEGIAEWRTRTLDYEDAPISRVVEDLNLFFPRQVKLADPKLGDQRVTIRLQVEDRERALGTLADILGLKITKGRDQETLSE
ncbi:FecR family protein [Sphingomonas colocasiae]|uniref:FecR domain-containing protein n=1 Tax=Sphingomonas colocasiae TaxID=1848973 RepID=A0ABS7PIE2_9SPHN|nr:FecR domain-containing protein [Sphingomonas colocasiae]MBY8821063.1 FecR domain-containing protein [Sphingomonas colocasiae]